jgi:hypothetical protein
MPSSPTRPVTGSGAAGLSRGRDGAGRRLSIWRWPRLLRQRLELDLPPLRSDVTHRAPPCMKTGITAKLALPSSARPPRLSRKARLGFDRIRKTYRRRTPPPLLSPPHPTSECWRAYAATSVRVPAPSLSKMSLRWRCTVRRSRRHPGLKEWRPDWSTRRRTSPSPPEVQEVSQDGSRMRSSGLRLVKRS